MRIAAVMVATICSQNEALNTCSHLWLVQNPKGLPHPFTYNITSVHYFIIEVNPYNAGISLFKKHFWRQSIVKTVDFLYWPGRAHFAGLTMKLHVYCFVVYYSANKITFSFIKSWNTFIYCVYFKSKKELNYDRFVDLNILGAVRLVHSDPRIYRISFFLHDINLGD